MPIQGEVVSLCHSVISDTTILPVVIHTLFRFVLEENSQYMHTINTLEPNAWMHKVCMDLLVFTS